MLLSEYLNMCIETKNYFYGDDLSYMLETVLQQCASIPLNKVTEVKKHIEILNGIVKLIKLQKSYHIEYIFNATLAVVRYLDIVDSENKLKHEEI